MKWKTESDRGKERKGCLEACEPVVASHLLFVYRSCSASWRVPSRGKVLITAFSSSHFTNHPHCLRQGQERKTDRQWKRDIIRQSEGGGREAEEGVKRRSRERVWVCGAHLYGQCVYFNVYDVF